MKFSLGQVLSVSTGRLLCEFDKLVAILNHMTGESLFTHQLPRAERECAPWLRRWFPEIAGIDGEDVTPANWEAWLSGKRAALGDVFDVDRIPMDDHERKNPLAELCEMMGPERIVVVKRG